MRKLTILTAALAAAFSASATAGANSPWTPADGEGELTATFGSQTADRFFAGSAEMALPADLEQDSTTLSLSYGLSDRLALDLQIGYASSDFIINPVLSPEGGLDGFQDSRIGLRVNVAGAADDLPTVTFGLAALIKGSYDVGALPAIGDGESGFEVQALVGHTFDQGLTLSGGYAFRSYNNEVPSQNIFNIGLGYGFTEQFSAGLFYQDVNSDGDLDIGAPGFSPARFPEVDEDYGLFGASGSFALNDAFLIGLDFGRKRDGRNTAKSRFFQVSVTRLF
jgi:hypothetical protein